MKFMGKIAESLAEAGHDVASQKWIVLYFNLALLDISNANYEPTGAK